jgi:hypothetical protein
MKPQDLLNNSITAKWLPIPKDMDGFFDDGSNLYEQLPIVVASIEEGLYPMLEYIDKDNWLDACSDLSKERYKYYIQVEPIELI